MSKKKKEATTFSAVIAIAVLINRVRFYFRRKDQDKQEEKKKKSANLECNAKDAKNIMDMSHNRYCWKSDQAISQGQGIENLKSSVCLLKSLASLIPSLHAFSFYHYLKA